MNKYIDSEKLTDMIDNSIAYCQINYSDDYALGFEQSLREVKNFIDSLQQDQTEEWSEEDEKHINSIFNDFRQNVIPDKEDQEWLKNRFKSIRPKSHWKPSEEQMKYLRLAGNSFRVYEEGHKILFTLYNDLKKLV